MSVIYAWQGTLVRRRNGSRKRTQYVDTRFAKQGQAANQEAETAMEEIIRDIKENSGLLVPKDKKNLSWFTIGVAIVLIILGAVFASSLPSVGMILIFAGFVGIWAGALMQCYFYSPWGDKSSIDKVREYLTENKPKWNETLGKYGYTISWNLTERTVDYKGRRSGRSYTGTHRAPSADIFFNPGTGGQQVMMVSQGQPMVMNQGQQPVMMMNQGQQPMMMMNQGQQPMMMSQGQQPVMMNQGQPVMMMNNGQYQGQGYMNSHAPPPPPPNQ